MKSQRVGMWGAAAAALLVGVLTGLNATTAGGEAPRFETPAWGRRGALMLRGGSGGGALLLKHDAGGAVYRYDRARRALTPAGGEEWERAGGPIARCAEQLRPPPDVMRIDPELDRLFAGARAVETAGANALVLRASPSGRWAAVVSAAGPKGTSFLPFVGGGWASGQHYSQVFALPDATPRGEATRLEPAARRQILTPCWSPDEEFVVYTDIFFLSLYVVETASPSASQSTEVSR